jgi:hypothetical protein
MEANRHGSQIAIIWKPDLEEYSGAILMIILVPVLSKFLRMSPFNWQQLTKTFFISATGFCRIHRSHGVNLDLIDTIAPLASGDSEIKLNNGKVLNLSRRYKEQLKSKLYQILNDSILLIRMSKSSSLIVG